MRILHNTIQIGLSEPFEVLHASDTHITDADERNDERKRTLARNRRTVFPDNEENLAFTAAYSREQHLPILHTGDLIDFVSFANLERAAAFAKENDLFFAAGNHEFSLYVGEAFEDIPYKMQSYDAVQACFGNDIGFAVREIGGVQFVAVDNSYYLFYEEHVHRLHTALENGKPTVLLFHVPLYEEDLFADAMQVKKKECAYLCAVPEEKMASYSPERFIQQKADALTRETAAYIAACPQVKAILTGHLHYDYEGLLGGRIPQLVTGLGTIRRIRFE